MTHSAKVVFLQLAVALVYPAVGELTLRALSSNGAVAAFWPASGFALAILLLGGKRYGVGLLIGAIVQNALTGVSLPEATVIGASNVLEALLGAWLLTRDGRFDPAFPRLWDYLRLVGLAGFVACLVSAAVGATTLRHVGFLKPEDYATNLIQWWMGDVLGVVVVAPLLLACRAPGRWLNRAVLGEFALVLALTLLAGQVVFLGLLRDIVGATPMGYLMFPPAIWAAVRLGLRGALAVQAVAAVEGLLGAHHGIGLFAHDIVQTKLTNYWLFMMFYSTGITSLAVFNAQRQAMWNNLEKPRSLLRTIVDTVPLRVFWKDRDLRFLGCNPVFAADAGMCRPEDLLGRDDREMSWSDQAERYRADDRAVIESGTARLGYEEPQTTPDGRTLWLRTSKVPLRNARGDVIGVLGVYDDITERKEAEKAMAEVKNRLEATLHAIPDLLFELDGDGRYHGVFASNPEQLAVPAAELLGQTVQDILPPQAAATVLAALREAADGGRSMDKEFELALAQGTFWFELSVAQKPVAPGQDARFIVISRDITQRKRTEIALTTARDQIKATLAALPDLLLEMSGQGHYRAVYAHNARLLHIPIAELIDRTVFDILPRPQAEIIMAALDEARQQGRSYGKTLLAPVEHGNFWFELSVARKRIHAGLEERFIMLVRDVTARKQAEARLEHSLSILGATLNSTDDGLLVVGNDRRIERYNDRFVEMWNVPRWIVDQTDDHPLLDHVAGQLEDPESFVRRVLELFDSDRTSVDILHLKDGRIFERYTQPRPVVGHSAGRVWRFRDITVQVRIEDELRLAAAAFDSQEPMLITDARGVILRVNHAFTQSTGYSAAEAVGQTPRLLRSGRHDKAFYDAMWQSIHATGGWQGEIWDRRKNGEIYPKWLTISAVRDDTGTVTHYIGAHIDISERKRSEQKIEHLAFVDQLTGVSNRVLLLDRLRQTVATAARTGNHGALLFIDLDHFKTLNDTLGHALGDQLLKKVAKRLTQCVREGDTVARLGGDEFVVVLTGLGQAKAHAAAGAETVAEKIHDALNRTFSLDGVVHHSTASIGITLFGAQHAPAEELMMQADMAMYKSKNGGRNTWNFFDPRMESAMKQQATLQSDLRKAVDRQEFQLHYQVQVAGDGRVGGVEALVRWQHPLRGTVSPAEFIPAAEESGIIVPLGNWVMNTACAQLAAWASRTETAQLSMAVNVSAHQFRQSDFVDRVMQALDSSGADPRRLKIELTESLLVHNVEDIIAKMRALKAVGVGFSLDDFGTGYSSLSYLKRMPLDQLKIDRSFVRDILTDANDAAIAGTVVALARSMGLAVIAEGVETAAQRDALARLGCHAYQGYLYGRPLPIDQLEALLQPT